MIKVILMLWVIMISLCSCDNQGYVNVSTEAPSPDIYMEPTEELSEESTEGETNESTQESEFNETCVFNDIAFPASFGRVIALDDLKVRTGPGVEYDIDYVLYPNDIVKILSEPSNVTRETNEDASTSYVDAWYHVLTRSGNFGYVNGRWLDKFYAEDVSDFYNKWITGCEYNDEFTFYILTGNNFEDFLLTIRAETKYIEPTVIKETEIVYSTVEPETIYIKETEPSYADNIRTIPYNEYALDNKYSRLAYCFPYYDKYRNAINYSMYSIDGKNIEHMLENYGSYVWICGEVSAIDVANDSAYVFVQSVTDNYCGYKKLSEMNLITNEAFITYLMCGMEGHTYSNTLSAVGIIQENNVPIFRLDYSVITRLSTNTEIDIIGGIDLNWSNEWDENMFYTTLDNGIYKVVINGEIGYINRAYVTLK